MKELFDLKVNNARHKHIFHFYLKDMLIYYKHGRIDDEIYNVTKPIDFTHYIENKAKINKGENVIDLFESITFDICFNDVNSMYFIETDRSYVYFDKDELLDFFDAFCYRINTLIENDLLEIH